MTSEPKIPVIPVSDKLEREGESSRKPGVECMLGHAPTPLTANGLDIRVGHPAVKRLSHLVHRRGSAGLARFASLSWVKAIRILARLLFRLDGGVLDLETLT